jgi:quercetin dioxygenase-like cupin family protein
MIFRNNDSRPVKMMPGLFRRTLACSNSMMICQFNLDSGVEIPEHAHPHEQVGYVVLGKIRITICGQSFELGPGDCYRALSEDRHSAIALEASVVVDTFSPPREDYR